MYVLDHCQGINENGLLELHFVELKSLESFVGISGAVCTMGIDAPALEYSSLQSGGASL